MTADGTLAADRLGTDEIAMLLAIPPCIATLVGFVIYVRKRRSDSWATLFMNIELQVLHDYFLDRFNRRPTARLSEVSVKDDADRQLRLTHYLTVLKPAYVETHVDQHRVVQAVVVTKRTPGRSLPLRIARDHWVLGKDTLQTADLPSIDVLVRPYQRGYGYWEVSLGAQGWMSYKVRAAGVSDVGSHQGWADPSHFSDALTCELPAFPDSGGRPAGSFSEPPPDYVDTFAAMRRRQCINCVAVTAPGIPLFPELFSLHGDDLVDRDSGRNWSGRRRWRASRSKAA